MTCRGTRDRSPGTCTRVLAPAVSVAFTAILLLAAAAATAQTADPAPNLEATLQSKTSALSSLWQEQDYAGAVAVLTEILALPDLGAKPWYLASTWYNLACAHALLGHAEDALAALERAGEAGFGDWRTIEGDPDLSSLHADPRFDRLLEHIRASALVWESWALASAYCESLPESERIAGLSAVWSEVRYGTAYPEKLIEANWDSLYLAFLPRVRGATDTEQYYRVLEEFVARFGDGHTSVDVPGDLFSTMYSRPELDTRMLGGVVAVVAVLSDSLAAPGIRPGLEVVSVDGLPVREYAQRFVAPYASASTPQSLEASVYGLYLLCGSSSVPVRVGFRDESGATFERTLARSRHRVLSYDEDVQFSMLGSSLAYVALNSFGDDAVTAAFDSLFAWIGEARGLILDLRQNTGGNSDVGYDILAYLADEPFQTGIWQTRVYDPRMRAWGMATRWHTTVGPTIEPHPSKHYAGPVAVLCGPLTGSAAEDFLMAFDVMGRGTIIGEPTAGSSGQPVWFSLPGGGTGRVCGCRTTYPDGTEYVGRGIVPDILVHTTLADVRRTRDPVLEAAEAALDSLRKAHPELGR